MVMFKKFTLFLILVFSLAIFNSNNKASALEYVHGWVTPYWSARYLENTNFEYDINSFGCPWLIGSTTNTCGKLTDWTASRKCFPANSKIAYFDLRDASNSQAGRNFKKGLMATIRIKIDTKSHSDSPLPSFSGATYLEQKDSYHQPRPVFFPLGNTTRVKTLSDNRGDNEYPISTSQTIEIDMIQTNDAWGGSSVGAMVSFYMANVMGSMLTVDSFITYKTVDEYLTATNQKLEDIKGLLEKIKNESNVSAVVNEQRTTNKKLDSVNTSLQQQKEQQKEQYDKEKKEEKDRENQGNKDAQKSASVFNFKVINPIEGLFQLFVSDQCTAIPTIAGMINSPTAQYCSWFPASVRSIMTPAFGLASSMLLFGFIMSWLKHKGGF